MQAVLTSEAFAFIPDPIKATPAFDIADIIACIGVARNAYEGKTAHQWLEESRGPVCFDSLESLAS